MHLFTRRIVQQFMLNAYIKCQFICLLSMYFNQACIPFYCFSSLLQREVEKFAMRFCEKVKANPRWIFEESE